MQTLTAQATIQISRPPQEVYEAVTNPDMMRHYFIATGTGIMENGVTIEWSFPEFPGKFPVLVKEVRPFEYIAFDWSGGEPGQLVEIFLAASNDNATVIKVVEHEMQATPDGIVKMRGQTEGWANFLACMKAYLEYGIHLRRGAFDFMKQ